MTITDPNARYQKQLFLFVFAFAYGFEHAKRSCFVFAHMPYRFHRGISERNTCIVRSSTQALEAAPLGLREARSSEIST
jgi:hypothetical protein